MTFFGLLTPGYVKEYTEHDAINDTCVVALPASGNPTQFILYYDAEIDFIWTYNCARGRERGSHPVTIGRMNMRGQILERDLYAPRQAPKIKG